MASSDFTIRRIALDFAEHEASTTGGQTSIARAKEFEDYLLGKSEAPQTVGEAKWFARDDRVIGPHITFVVAGSHLDHRRRLARRVTRWLNDAGET